MEAKTKKSLLAASLACVAVGAALCVTASVHSAFASEDDSKPCKRIAACEQAAEDIIGDLESVVNGYNEVFGADWTASKIDYIAEVYIVDDNEYGPCVINGIYVDLDGDNGYMVISTDKKIYGLETSGDLDYLRGVNKLYFSYIDGFMYKDGNGQYKKFNEDDVDDIWDMKIGGAHQVGK